MKATLEVVLTILLLTVLACGDGQTNSPAETPVPDSESTTPSSPPTIYRPIQSQTAIPILPAELIDTPTFPPSVKFTASVDQPEGDPEAPLPSTVEPDIDQDFVELDTGQVCTDDPDGPCSPRDVSDIALFIHGRFHGSKVSVEDILEKGPIGLEDTPTHIVFEGTGKRDSVRCVWQGSARTLAQREAAIRD